MLMLCSCPSDRDAPDLWCPVHGSPLIQRDALMVQRDELADAIRHVLKRGKVGKRSAERLKDALRSVERRQW